MPAAAGKKPTTAREALASVGAKRVKIEWRDERIIGPGEDGYDSDDDAGAYDGPFVVRNRATANGEVEPGTAFEAWRPRPGLDREEIGERYEELVRRDLDDPFRANNIILRGKGDGVDYVGKNYTHTLSGVGRTYEREYGDRSRQMIGRLRKSSGKDGEYVMELIPIAGGKVIDLEARLHKYNYTEHKKSEYADLNDPAIRAAINAKQLEAFASDKRKRQVNRINAARKMDQDSIASPQMMETHIADGAANLKSRNDLIVEAGKTRNIPPHEGEATEASAAYPVTSTPCYQLFTKLHWKELLDAAKKDKLQTDGKYESLTVSLAETLKGGASSVLNERAKLIAFSDALCKLLPRDRVKEARSTLADDGETQVKPAHPFMYTSADNVDPDLQRAIIEEYMEEDATGDIRQFVMPKHKRDLIRLQVILIALRVNEWKIQLGELQEQLRIEMKELTNYTRQLGCKSASSGKNPTVKLDLMGKPLAAYLPEIRARAKRAKPRE